MEEKTCTLHSSHGEIIFNAITGQVIEVDLDGCEDCPSVGTVDVQEYKQFYNVDKLPDNIDILDVGYWDESEKYDEPAHEWRAEVATLRLDSLQDDHRQAIELLKGFVDWYQDWYLSSTPWGVDEPPVEEARKFLSEQN